MGKQEVGICKTGGCTFAHCIRARYARDMSSKLVKRKKPGRHRDVGRLNATSKRSMMHLGDRDRVPWMLIDKWMSFP